VWEPGHGNADRASRETVRGILQASGIALVSVLRPQSTMRAGSKGFGAHLPVLLLRLRGTRSSANRLVWRGICFTLREAIDDSNGTALRVKRNHFTARRRPKGITDQNCCRSGTWGECYGHPGHYPVGNHIRIRPNDQTAVRRRIARTNNRFLADASTGPSSTVMPLTDEYCNVH